MLLNLYALFSLFKSSSYSTDPGLFFEPAVASTNHYEMLHSSLTLNLTGQTDGSRMQYGFAEKERALKTKIRRPKLNNM